MKTKVEVESGYYALEISELEYTILLLALSRLRHAQATENYFPMWIKETDGMIYSLSKPEIVQASNAPERLRGS